MTPSKIQKGRAGKKDHYTAILLEEMRDQFKFVIEKVEGLEGSLRSEMAQNRAELKQDIADTRGALSLRIDNVEKSLGSRIDNVEKSLRVEMTKNKEELKTEIARINDVVIRHDADIAALKKSA